MKQVTLVCDRCMDAYDSKDLRWIRIGSISQYRQTSVFFKNELDFCSLDCCLTFIKDHIKEGNES